MTDPTERSDDRSQTDGRDRAPTSPADARVLPDLAGRTVLVTGGAGFIGSRLARALSGRCEVRVLDDLTTGDPAAVPDDATLVRGDVRDVADLHDAMVDVDVVFHQAALSDVGHSVRAPVETHGRNATGTVTVLEAARRRDARVVVASSAAVYGRPDSLPVHETDPKDPVSPYGVAKLASDQYARVYADQYGLPTVVLRYFNVYGRRSPDRGGVVETFAARARAGESLVLHGGGTQTRDFVHVADVVRANVRAAVTDATGRAYNVGTGEATSIRTVAERILAATDSTSDLVEGPSRAGDIDHSRAAIERTRDALDFRPRVGMEAGLRSVASEGPDRRIDDAPTAD